MELPTERDRLRLLVTLAVIGGVLALFALVWYRSTPPAPTLLLPDDNVFVTVENPAGEETGDIAAEVGVDVIGAVQRPGLYYFEPGARIADAVKAAGGYAPNADRDAINEAVRLKDEQQVRVPQIVRNAQAPTNPAVITTIAPTTAGVPETLLDLNSVDVQGLEALPGIGPSMAATDRGVPRGQRSVWLT